MIKDSKYVKINSANLLYLIFSKENVYFEEIYGKCQFLLMKAKKKIKQYEKLWSKIRDLIRLMIKNSWLWWKIYENQIPYDELSLNKTTEIANMIVVVRVVFQKNNKYYPNILLVEYLHKLWTIKNAIFW